MRILFFYFFNKFYKKEVQPAVVPQHKNTVYLQLLHYVSDEAYTCMEGEMEGNNVFSTRQM